MSNRKTENKFLPNSGSEPAINFLNNLTSICPYQINGIPNRLNRFLDLVFVDDNSCYDLHRTTPIVPEDPYHPALEIYAEVDNFSNVRDVNKASKSVNKVYAFNKTNVVELNRLLINTDWDSIIPSKIMNEEQLDEVVQTFYSTLYHYFDLTVPKSKPKSEYGPLWFNINLKRLRNKKSNLYKKFKRNGRSVDYINYIIARNHYTKCCNKAYRDHLSRVSQNVKDNPKCFWDFVNSKRKAWKHPSCMSFNGRCSDNDKDSCELFASFFKTVYSTSKSNLSDYFTTDVGYDVSFPLIDTELIESFSASLKTSFKVGPDKVPSFVLKTFCNSLSIPLCCLFNHSLNLGYFPMFWKKSFIIPLWKSGSKSNIKNYRGISKLSAIPKLFEQIITKQLAFELEKQISPFQHGFIAGRSTVTNLLEFTTILFQNFQRSLQTDVVFTDFSKAFDVVNHHILLLKLKHYGLPHRLLCWIKSYLTGRSQNVIFNSDISSEIVVTSGVPQGSHLGPLLFLLFINDLPSVITHSSILLYADDVKLFYASNVSSTCLQSDLNSLAQWCELNCMNLNINKCKHMVFTRKIMFSQTLSLCSIELEKVNAFCDLGVLLDPKLRFNLHINFIINKANRCLGFIKRWAKEFDDPYVTKLLFTSLVRPVLEYACIVWYPSYACDISSIESVQKQFLLFSLRQLRWDPNRNLPPYTSRLKLIDLQSLENRRTILNIVFIFKVLNGHINAPFLLEQLSLRVPSRRTRQNILLEVPYFTCNFLNFAPFRASCVKFNEFIEVIDFEASYNCLKQRLSSLF